jgi:hypothetical protein
MTRQQRWLFAGGWIALVTGASQVALGTLGRRPGQIVAVPQVTAVIPTPRRPPRTANDLRGRRP